LDRRLLRLIPGLLTAHGFGSAVTEHTIRVNREMKRRAATRRNSGTHSEAGSAALLLIDLINHFEFPDGPSILHKAESIARNIAKLKKRARAAGIPVIYVNDNFGDWKSDAARLLAYCLRSDAPGRNFIEQIKPDAEDYFVLKPMHSAFYQTPLDVLLRHLGVTTLIFAGLTTNSCILCSVHDANMRDYSIIVADDCCAARSEREHNQALEHIRAMADGKVVPSAVLRLGKLAGKTHPDSLQ
jgi:nicotinamidase-related amidase